MTLTAACDGSALGNPGPAGWAWYVDAERWGAGGWPESTNNRGELQAVIEVLRAALPLEGGLRLLCDSKYVINSVTQWMPKWKRSGWKKADKKDVLNRDQMEQLDALLEEYRTSGRSVDFEWVRGHSGHPLNDAADARANAAARAYQAGRAPEAGPGMSSGQEDAGSAGSDPEDVSPEDPGSERGAEAADASPGVSSDTREPAVAREDAPTVMVSCPLERELADRIVDRARSQGRTPQAELADIIRKGMSLR